MKSTLWIVLTALSCSLAGCALESATPDASDTEQTDLAQEALLSNQTQLVRNDYLLPGQSLVSRGCSAVLDMQTDGNLVLYGQPDPTGPRLALWATNTLGGTGRFMAMQADGNFVMYTPTFQPVWATGTHGNPNSFLATQNDGNVVVYRFDNLALWATHTNRSLLSGPNCARHTIFAHIDASRARNGSAFATLDLAGTSALTWGIACAKACTREPMCKSFSVLTYSPRLEEAFRRCTLFRDAPAWSVSAEITSGIICRFTDDGSISDRSSPDCTDPAARRR